MNADNNLFYAAELSLCIKDISIPRMFLEYALRKMAAQLKKDSDQDSPDYKRLSYYAQLTHSALLSLNAAEDTVSALALLMTQNETDK